MSILANDGDFFPSLGLARQTRDALARYVQLRWPVGTRKAVAKEFGLSLEAARTVCEARASDTTIDMIWKHPNGGWAVAVPILGAVIGRSIEDFHKQEAREHAAQARRHASLARDWRAVRPLRAGPPDELDARPTEVRRVVVRRTAPVRHPKAGGVK